MTRERVLEIYRELENLVVPVEKDPTLGLTYLREKMVDCRHGQDRIGTLLLEVNRDFSRVRQALRARKTAFTLAKSAGQTQILDDLRNQLNQVEDEFDDLRLLQQVIESRASNMKMTSSDIRLLVSVVETQMKLGEIRADRPSPFRTNRVDGPPSNVSSEPPISNSGPDLSQVLGTALPAQSASENAQSENSSSAFVATESEALSVNDAEEVEIARFLNSGS